MATTTLSPSMIAENKGSMLLTVNWVECGLAVLIVAIRMYTRAHLIHNVGLDDWAMVLALVSKTALSVCLSRICIDNRGSFLDLFSLAS